MHQPGHYRTCLGIRGYRNFNRAESIPPYTTAGTYTVNLTVTGPGGSNTATQTAYITVGEAPPIAGFSGTPTSGPVPLTVTFTDASTGLFTGYAWEFGDTGTSTEQNPSHQYTTAGTILST